MFFSLSRLDRGVLLGHAADHVHAVLLHLPSRQRAREAFESQREESLGHDRRDLIGDDQSRDQHVEEQSRDANEGLASHEEEQADRRSTTAGPTAEEHRRRRRQLVREQPTSAVERTRRHQSVVVEREQRRAQARGHDHAEDLQSIDYNARVRRINEKVRREPSTAAGRPASRHAHVRQHATTLQSLRFEQQGTQGPANDHGHHGRLCPMLDTGEYLFASAHVFSLATLVKTSSSSSSP